MPCALVSIWYTSLLWIGIDKRVETHRERASTHDGDGHTLTHSLTHPHTPPHGHTRERRARERRCVGHYTTYFILRVYKKKKSSLIVHFRFLVEHAPWQHAATRRALPLLRDTRLPSQPGMRPGSWSCYAVIWFAFRGLCVLRLAPAAVGLFASWAARAQASSPWAVWLLCEACRRSRRNALALRALARAPRRATRRCLGHHQITCSPTRVMTGPQSGPGRTPRRPRSGGRSRD